MSNIAIRVDGLSKRYRIGAAKQRHDTLRDAMTEAFGTIFRFKGRRSVSGAQDLNASDTIWALKDVSFELKEGEVLGIIGRNGAGKSTLLKILSRITEPTEGEAQIYGRVGTLLEVGTGFHGELTGRENIYLNGAVLGMKKAEINKKFDDIVSFSEIEKFIDTPVKRYSSGMYMRLAFAVAAHLEPQILIVDEVLAVGDLNFQKKCLGKMGEIAKQGRTVLFVSHNMAAVQSLCSHGIMLDAGRVTYMGPINDVVERYLEAGELLSSTPLKLRLDRDGDGSARIVSINIRNADGGHAIQSTSRLEISLNYESERELQHARFLLAVHDAAGRGIFLLNSEVHGTLPAVLPPKGRIVCITDPINITPGKCIVHLGLLKGEIYADDVLNAMSFEVEADGVHGSRIPPRSWVLCLIKQQWTVSETDSEIH
jgi:lipopolysaccharide transport system ATP-binding protein